MVLGLLVLIGGIFYFKKEYKDSERIDNLSPSLTTINITTLSKQVFQTNLDGSVKTEISSSTSMTINGGVETGENGRALLEAPNHRLVMDFNSRVILEPQINNYSNLEEGSIWATIEKSLEKGQFSEIETKNAVAAVRGTSYGLNYGKQTTILMVTEGAVWFAPKDPMTGLINEKKAVIVGPGEKAIRVDQGEIIISKLNADDLRNEWFKFNNPNYKTVGSTPKPTISPEPTIQLNPTPSPSITSTPTPTSSVKVPPSETRDSTPSPTVTPERNPTPTPGQNPY